MYYYSIYTYVIYMKQATWSWCHYNSNNYYTIYHRHQWQHQLLLPTHYYPCVPIQTYGGTVLVLLMLFSTIILLLSLSM